MEYTSYFRSIQTALTHCNEFARKFDKINDYGGNEVYINEIALKLTNIFLANGFHQENCEELRKVNLFLMLNTSAKFKYDLNEDFQICHLLNNFPQLTKSLYSNLMWQMKLHKYFYEAVIYSPPWFTVEFLYEAIDNLRFSKSFDIIRQVREVVEAIYTSICRMDYRTNRSDNFNDKKLILERYIDAVSTAIRHYNTPITEDSITNSKKKMREYNGHSLNYQLSLIISCLKMFQKKPAFEVNDDFEIYKINPEKEPETNNFSTSSYSSAVNEALSQINVILLNTLQNTLCSDAVDLTNFIYLADVEIEDNEVEEEELKRDTLQKAIGEKAYELIDLINEIPNFEHDVIKQLAPFSSKPLTIAEIAKDATIGTILEKIESSKSRVVWLEELLTRTDTLYFNTECLQTIIDNIEIVTFEHLIRILKDHENFEEEKEEEDEAQINKIFLKGGGKLNVDEKRDFIEILINELGTDYCLSPDIELIREQEITNYLNKITEDNIEVQVMWNLILKNPQIFFEKLLEDIDSQDESQITTILKVISTTIPISNIFVKKIIFNDVNIVTENSSRHLLLFGIFKQQIVERKEFIKDILMSNFSQALSSNAQSTSILIYLKTLKSISSHLKITDLLPPLIIQLAFVLDIYRWDLMSYTGLKEEIVDTTISIIQDLIKTVLINGSKNDKEWIKSKINSLKLMTKFYFQKLSLEKGEPITPLDEFLHNEKFTSIPKIKIISFLCETIVRCTSKEIRKLMNNEILRNFYTESLILVSTIVKKSNQSAPLECLRKCVTDHVKILMDTIIPASKSKNQECELLKEIVTLIKKLPAELYDDLTILFLDAIKEMKSCENFLNLISDMDDCELKRIVLE